MAARCCGPTAEQVRDATMRGDTLGTWPRCESCAAEERRLLEGVVFIPSPSYGKDPTLCNGCGVIIRDEDICRFPGTNKGGRGRLGRLELDLVRLWMIQETGDVDVPPRGPLVTESASYDSRPDTYAHILRVAELLSAVAAEIVRRGVEHDRSKVQPPEVDTFDEFTPKLKRSTYGSDEYKGFLAAMGEGLQHHYAHNRHHPEHHADGIAGMTLVDLIEMLADWKAATERHDDGCLERSLTIQAERFGIDSQLACILRNTAESLGWLP